MELYNCIKMVMFDDIPWLSEQAFKHYLKIKDINKIDGDHLQKIEKKINRKLIITGGIEYNSEFKSFRVIQLKYINNEYTLLTRHNHKIQRMVSFSCKTKPMIYNKLTFMVYDGIKEYKLSKVERNTIYNKKTDKILIPKRDNDKTLKEEYDDFIKLADGLNIASNYEINVYKTGSFVITALNLFDKYTYDIQTDDILPIEANFIRLASCGALMFSNENYKADKVYEYDIVSLYPSIQCSDMRFPIKQGEIKYILTSELPEHFQYGIYRCMIQKITTRLFRYNKNNYYTHFDLERAKELGLKIEMIEDGENNFLHYDRSKLILGRQLFGKFIDKLYPLKEQGIDGAKDIMNCLWGALCELEYSTSVVEQTDEFEYKDEIRMILPTTDKTKNIVKQYNEKKTFIYNYGRLKPFLLSNGRYKMSKLIEPIIDDVIRTHTDSVFITYKLDGKIAVGEGMGQLKCKGHFENFEVENINKYDGLFVKY